MASGGAHSCAVQEDGLVRCWGYNGQGQATVHPDLGQAKAVTTGTWHSRCGVFKRRWMARLAKTAGATTATAKPRDVGEPTSPWSKPTTLSPPSQSPPVMLTAAPSSRAGRFRCWGRDRHSFLDVPARARRCGADLRVAGPYLRPRCDRPSPLLTAGVTPNTARPRSPSPRGPNRPDP